MTTIIPLHIPQDHWRSRWLLVPNGSVLHRVASIEWEHPDEMIAGKGTTVCGLSRRLHMPGIFSRMGLKRCPACCLAMGIPEGEGAPYNDGLLEPGDLPNEDVAVSFGAPR